jgi:hypothetical protein
MRRGVLVFFCSWMATGWAAQLFIPVDEYGNPLEPPVPVVDEPPEDASAEEDAWAALEREAREAEFARTIEQASVDYAECLRIELERFFGPDFGNCTAERDLLAALYPTDAANTILGCIQAAVVQDGPLSDADCPILGTADMRPADNAERWR